MKGKFVKKRKDSRGFTLVELVIVVAILAILVGLLAPQYTKYVERSRMTADAENLNEMVKAFQVAVADLEGGVTEGSYSITITDKTYFDGPGGPIPTEVDGTTTSANSDNVEPDINTSAYKDLYEIMCEVLGDDWQDIGLKSNNWIASGDSTSISKIEADIDVGSDGSVSVDYIPAQLKQITAKLEAEEK